MKIANNTHYYNQYTKIFNFVLDTNSFQYESCKRTGYFQRLYYEFQYTKKVKGQTFFYTFTYNDKSIPKFHGRECYSYEDIRYITNGALSKRLKRDFGSRLKYFCACESGEGKGKRGLGHNPHYHFIFFVQPLHDKDNNPIYDGYKIINPYEFRDYCMKLWQGDSGFVRFQDAKYGICKPGNFLGLVADSTPFNYVSKYVTKDNNDISLENYARRIYEIECRSLYGFSADVIVHYYNYLKVVNPLFDVSLSDLINDLMIHQYNRWRRSTKFVDNSFMKYIHEHGNLHTIEIAENLYSWFIHWYIPNYVEFKVSEFKSKYSGKVRCSKSLGEYGLQFVQNVDSSPKFNIPLKKGYKLVSPCLYYIRKLYYDIKICPVSGNPLYYLNNKGIQLKLNSLNDCIDSTVKSLREKISYVVFNNIIVQNDCFQLLKDFHSVPELTNIMFRRYAIYKIVYEFRKYDSHLSTLTDSDLNIDHVKHDYEFFLRQSSYYLDYENYNISTLIYNPVFCHSYYEGCQDYCNHPMFAPYIKYFDLFDKISDVVNYIYSDKRKKEFVESSEHLKRINSMKYNALVC